MATKTIPTPLDLLHADIVEALTELRGARHEYDHCPSTDNKRTVEYAESRLNKLIDRRGDVKVKRESVKSR